MTLGALLCGSLFCFLHFNGIAGFPVKQVHGNGQTADEDLYWDPTKVWQPAPRIHGEAQGPNMWAYSGSVEPRRVKNAAHQAYPPSSSEFGLQAQNGGHNQRHGVFERGFQLHPEDSSASNYAPSIDGQSAYPPDTWWHYNFARDDNFPSLPAWLPKAEEEEEAVEEDPDEPPTYIIRSRNGHERGNFLFTKASSSPRVVHPLVGYHYYARKRFGIKH